jgi:glycosyltransferase involved in cell wall biosynthesis
MRVFYISDVPAEPGTGGGVVAYHHLKALKRAGLLADVAAPRVPPDIAEYYFRIDPAAYNMPHHPYVTDYLASVVPNPRDLDVLHLHGGTFHHTVNRFGGRARLVVSEVPAHDLQESMREFANLGLSYPFPHMVVPCLWEAYTSHIRRSDVVICPSNTAAANLRRLGFKNRIEVVEHGCTPPEKTFRPPQHFNVLNVASVGPDKGHIYLLRAWHRLRLPLATLTVVGQPGPAYGNQEVREGLHDVAWYPQVKDVSPLYHECSVYVQPSVTEGFGIPVLEAMAHARPVIVSTGAGVSELVRDGVDGFHVKPRDVGGLVEKIQYFYDNPGEIVRMGENARQQALNYTWDRVGEKLVKLYRELEAEQTIDQRTA